MGHRTAAPSIVLFPYGGKTRINFSILMPLSADVAGSMSQSHATVTPHTSHGNPLQHHKAPDPSHPGPSRGAMR